MVFEQRQSLMNTGGHKLRIGFAVPVSIGLTSNIMHITTSRYTNTYAFPLRNTH